MTYPANETPIETSRFPWAFKQLRLPGMRQGRNPIMLATPTARFSSLSIKMRTWCPPPRAIGSGALWCVCKHFRWPNRRSVHIPWVATFAGDAWARSECNFDNSASQIEMASLRKTGHLHHSRSLMITLRSGSRSCSLTITFSRGSSRSLMTVVVLRSRS